MTEFKVFEWPDREEARRLWQENSRQRGPGCFLFDSTDQGKPGGFLIAVAPTWATKKALKGLPEVLYKNTMRAIRDAGILADRAILVNLNYHAFQIIKIPFDASEMCELIFEAILGGGEK